MYDQQNRSRKHPQESADAVLQGRPATLHDVAREAGVSVATASRALNGSTRNVRQENVARVLAAAAALNYEPHLSAQAIARGSTKTAALVVGDIDDPYFSSIAAGVTQAAEAEGLVVAMAVTVRSAERELEIVRTLRGHRPRVILIAGSRTDEAEVRPALIRELVEYQKVGGRVAIISQDELPFNTVTIDNVGGARRLALALAELGYRKFAVLHAGDGLLTSRDRYAGFLTGLDDAGIRFDDRLAFETSFTRSGGYQAARRLVEHLEGVELVFAVNDVMAIGAMTAFRDVGLTPGIDIAVAGFDDISSATDVVPSLTTVSVPLHEVGQAAVRLALQADSVARVERVSTTVVLRDSSPRR